LLIVAAAAIVTTAWLVAGTRLACQVTTVTGASSPARISSAGTSTTKVCGTPDVSDYFYVLAVVGLLLLPDAKSLKIGGLEFERLTTEVSKQASEIGQLRQEISTVVNSTNNLSVLVGDVTRLAFADFRAHFRRQRAVLEKIRSLLPIDPQTAADLLKIDGFAKRIDDDDLDWFELQDVLQCMRSLLAANLAASGTEGDTVVGAQRAEDVLPGILGGEPAAS
jgi:hypothetical protein